jgi:sec-independent protein translocase protein TatC
VTSPPSPTEAEDLSDEGTMTFWEHLEELRTRLLKALVAAAIGGAFGWFYRKQLLLWLAKPLMDAWPKELGPVTIHISELAEAFFMYLKIAFLGGFVLAFPLIAYQIWAFIAPGLYKKEKRFALAFVSISCGLFALGSYFCWRFAFPLAAQYLLSYAGQDPDLNLPIQPTLMITQYVSFITKILIAFGLIFELPVVVAFLAAFRVLDHTHLLKFFRYFVVVAFIVAALLTPPDPLSQIMMAVPLVLLYGISIGVAFLINRRHKARDAAPADAEAP